MTRFVRFANNATSKLAANLSSVGLTISLTPGDGSKFPALTGNQFFKATLIKADGTKEVVKVTARSTDTLTVQRAAEAIAGVQTAYAFSAGDKFELRLTAKALEDELDRLDAAAYLDVVNKSANYTITEADISKLIKTDTSDGPITMTLPQISTLTASFEVQISKNTGDANVLTIARSGTDTINGSTSYLLASQYQCLWLVADLTTGTWTAITSANASNKITDQFIGAGTAGPFTLSGDPGSKNNTDVYVGGVYQPKSSYTLSGTSLTLGGVVGAGVIVECNWAQPLPVGTPSDGTVTPAKLADTTKAAIQSQTWTGFTSAGAAPAYTLTPTPTILAYAAGQRFRVAAHAAGTTGSNTLNIAGLGAKNLKQYDSTGTKVPAVVASGQLMDVEYDGTDMVLLNPLVAAQVSVLGAFKNLQASATGLNANVSVSVDEIVVSNASNQYATLRAVSLTIAGTSVGANALDAGTIATSTWYSVWVIWNGTTTAGLLSTSATAPTLPSGYTHKARIGWMRTDGTANKYPLSFIQYGRTVQYKVAAGSNLAAYRQISSGVQGNAGTPTYVALSVSTFVPTTASKVSVITWTPGTATTLLSSNNATGGSSNSSNPPAYSFGAAASQYTMQKTELVLESSNIYYAADSGSSAAAVCGWEDNL